MKPADSRFFSVDALEPRVLLSAGPQPAPPAMPRPPVEVLLAPRSVETLSVDEDRLAESPPSNVGAAMIDGLTGGIWPAAVCYLASLGQLIQYYDPTTTIEDVIVRSGFATQADWTVYSVDKYFGNHPRNYDNGAMIDLARNSGVGYNVAYLNGGGGGVGWCLYADSVTKLDSQAAAVDMLKSLIDQGIPVQVHVDYYIIVQETADLVPGWGGSSPNPCSHFFVVHGYDETNVYYTDNIQRPGDPDPVGVPITWETFIDGWYAGGLTNPDPHLRCGPYYMTWLSNEPAPVATEWLLKYLAADAADAPGDLRKAAADFRGGVDASQYLDHGMRVRFTQVRQIMADYLGELGHDDIAALYTDSASLWAQIRDVSDDWSGVPDLLDQIADVEQSAHALMLALDGGDELYAMCMPETLNPGDAPQDAVFRWVVKPGIKTKAVLQLSDDPLFSDSRRIVKASLKGRGFISLPVKTWRKAAVLAGEGKTLYFRVLPSAKGAAATSAAEASWDVLAFAASGLADSAQVLPDATVSITYNAPGLAAKPVLVLSRTADFSDAKGLVKIKGKPGLPIAITPKHLAAIRKKLPVGVDEVFWRLEDASAAKTTVGASATLWFELL